MASGINKESQFGKSRDVLPGKHVVLCQLEEGPAVHMAREMAAPSLRTPSQVQGLVPSCTLLLPPPCLGARPHVPICPS